MSLTYIWKKDANESGWLKFLLWSQKAGNILDRRIISRFDYRLVLFFPLAWANYYQSQYSWMRVFSYSLESYLLYECICGVLWMLFSSSPFSGAFQSRSIKQAPLCIIHTILKTHRVLPWFLTVGVKISFPSSLERCCLDFLSESSCVWRPIF